MSSTENEDLQQRYSALQELYQKVIKEKQDALEETERATISFARHFDSEVGCGSLSYTWKKLEVQLRAPSCELIQCYYRRKPKLN